MPVSTHTDGNKLEIRVEGRFDFTLHREFRNAYRESDGPRTDYVVNLRGVDYLDSSALGMLLLLREHAGGDRSRVKIANCHADVCRILQIANFEKLFTVSK